MAEQAVELTTQQKFDKIQQEYAKVIQTAGIHQYNAQDHKSKLAECNVMIRNLTLELNKIGLQLQKEKLESEVLAAAKPAVALVPEQGA